MDAGIQELLNTKNIVNHLRYKEIGLGTYIDDVKRYILAQINDF